MKSRRLSLLAADVDGIQAFLDEFNLPPNGEMRVAEINSTGELVTVRNMPLPDGFDPDYVDLLIIAADYPNRPPIGLYLLERDNRQVISQLERIFNVMQTAAYQAETVSGYVWLCVIYENNTWKFNADKIGAGDNLRKFLIGFYNRCHSDLPRGR